MVYVAYKTHLQREEAGGKQCVPEREHIMGQPGTPRASQPGHVVCSPRQSPLAACHRQQGCQHANPCCTKLAGIVGIVLRK